MLTTGVGLFRDFLPAPRICKDFFQVRHSEVIPKDVRLKTTPVVSGMGPVFRQY